MPSATPPRNALTFEPMNKFKQSRYRSTGQELKTPHDDERIAAMLHGKNRNGLRKEASRIPSSEHAASHPSPSHRNAQTSMQSEQPSNRSRNQVQWELPSIAGKKRKATSPLNQRSARRQRSNAPELKDEAFIRSTMRIPTPQEYPNAPKDVFKNPKSSILNIAHGHQVAECRSEVTTLAKDVYQCTAYYNSASHTQAVVGEGRTQASRADSPENVMLISHRKPPKTLLGYTW